MTRATLLFTRPDYDRTTRYISAWASEVIEKARAKGHFVLDLAGERARRKEVESVIRRKNPAAIFLNGHGNEGTVCGQEDEVIIKAGENEGLLKDAIIYALSCRSAKMLGAASVKSGARAYIGYEDDFIFIFTTEKRTHPLEDRTAGLFLEPSNKIPLSVIKGHTIEEACLNAKKAFFKNIQKLLNSQTPSDEADALRYLVWDLRHLAFHGDSRAYL